MNNLLNRERSTSGLLARPFADVWSFDPFRNFSSALGVDVSRTETGYTVEMPVAGFKPEDVEVTLEDGLLTVRAKNDRRQFARTLTVPEDVDEERIEANVEFGMLTLTLNLLPKAQPKKIQVK